MKIKNTKVRFVSRLVILILCICFFTNNSFAQKRYKQKGKASFYANKFIGRKTSNGEIFSQKKLTAAHKYLPFGTKLKVTNLDNNRSIIVVVNDRGPFIKGRIIDLTKYGANKLGFIKKGVATVLVEQIVVKSNKKIASKIINESEYFKVDSQFDSPKGFGVQIGSFTEMNNIFLLIAKQRKRTKLPIYIQTKKKNNKNLYRIIVGNVESRHKAEVLVRHLVKHYPGCFATIHKTN